MPLSPGFRLGVYEILAKLGEGGMGEVYRARDTRLKRDVAIKVLPESFAREPERIIRFEREAELLATLNHPNIAGIHGFEETSSVNGIVLELVEGPTLWDRIGHRALPIDEALSIAKQVLDALEAAHDKGIVHRDLKPANIKITPGGTVKVLDFGLAKAMESVTAPASVQLSMSPTMVSPATQSGIILGTAAYMSPEQARGKAVDQRADIWAFGCLLYEMLCGRPPFDTGETVSDAIAAVLTRDPDWHALPASTPSSVRRLLRRCLEKDAERRLHHVADARLELDDTGGDSAPIVAAAKPTSRWRTAAPWVIAALAAGVALFVLFSKTPARSAPAPLTRLELNLPPDLELFASAGSVALSPDGSRVAFIGVQSGARHIFVRRLDQFELTLLPSTDNASMCFFSADGKSIGFVTSSGILKTIALTDGVIATLDSSVSFLSGAAWNADGNIIIARENTLWRVASSGGRATALTTLDASRNESRHAWPIVLPGGATMLFGVESNNRWRVDALDLASGQRRTVLENGTLPMYASAGQLMFVRDTNVLAAPFDVAALAVTGPEVQLLANIPLLNANIPLVAISPSGTVIYSPSTVANRLMWVSRRGEEVVLNEERRSYTNPRIAPDGQRIVVQAGDLWTQDIARSTFSRLTNGEALANAFPIWLSDSRVMYRSIRGLRIQGTSGPSDAAQMIAGTTELDYPGALAPDGDTLLFQRSTESTLFNIMAVSLRDQSKVWPIVQTPAYESGARLSPDGRWLTYVSNETGRNEVYVAPFQTPGERLQVSTQGGTQAIWNPNGKEIFYRIEDKMMAVDVMPTPTLKLSSPKVLFEARYAYGAGITIANFDVSRDGQRFLMVKPESSAGRLNVVLNWFADRVRDATPN